MISDKPPSGVEPETAGLQNRTAASGVEAVKQGVFAPDDSAPTCDSLQEPRRHQSQLPPAANKFHKGNGGDGKHYWLTPPDLYTALDAEFQFTFDPCPHPLPDGFDGLTCEWGASNYVNPPFGSIMHDGRKKGPTAWIRKAIEEHAKGKRVVLVYPVDKWVLMILKAVGAAQVRSLGDVKWCAIEDGTPGKGTGRHIACFILDHDIRPSAQHPARVAAPAVKGGGE